MKLWKWFGLAGIAGVAATGLVTVRNERQRRAYTPDEVRERLHDRYADTVTSSVDAPDSTISPKSVALPERLARAAIDLTTAIRERIPGLAPEPGRHRRG